MRERNFACWISVAKRSILSLAAAFALIVSSSSAQADWTLIDNFEGLTAGAQVSGTTGPGANWDGDGTLFTAAVDPSDGSNLAMQLPGIAPNQALRAQFSSASTNIAAGATGTLYYRFRTPDTALGGTTDAVVGLTDTPDITNFNFKAGLRNTVPAGANNMDVRNGGSYQSVATLADSTWYSLWMVATNTNPGTFELYLQSDTDANFAAQTQLASPATVFDFRINSDNDIINVYFRGALNAGGTADSNLYYDDIWVNSNARDLSVPVAAAIPEPTSAALLVTGMGMFVMRRRRR
jgi:hypothetical protein